MKKSPSRPYPYRNAPAIPSKNEQRYGRTGGLGGAVTIDATDEVAEAQTESYKVLIRHCRLNGQKGFMSCVTHHLSGGSAKNGAFYPGASTESYAKAVMEGQGDALEAQGALDQAMAEQAERRAEYGKNNPDE